LVTGAKPIEILKRCSNGNALSRYAKKSMCYLLK